MIQIILGEGEGKAEGEGEGEGEGVGEGEGEGPDSVGVQKFTFQLLFETLGLRILACIHFLRQKVMVKPRILNGFMNLLWKLRVKQGVRLVTSKPLTADLQEGEGEAPDTQSCTDQGRGECAAVRVRSSEPGRFRGGLQNSPS